MTDDPTPPLGMWPLYASGPEKHMQALGVIAVNYNLFEGSLYPLFAHHLLRAGLSDDECKYMFWTYTNEQRLTALVFIFRQREKDPEVIERIEYVKKYWWHCAEKRHMLMHSRLDFLAPIEPLATLMGIDEERTLSLVKPAKDDWGKVNHMRLSLRGLQSIADEIHCGYTFAVDLWSYLAKRDGPAGMFDLGPRPLPDKPRMRRKIKIRPPPEALATWPPKPFAWPELPPDPAGTLVLLVFWGYSEGPCALPKDREGSRCRPVAGHTSHGLVVLTIELGE